MATIRDDFQWPLSNSNREWVELCAEHKLHQIRELEGIQIYFHGYGIELKYPDLVIDFDWGENGLFPHRCMHKLVNCWLDVAFDKGQSEKDTYLCCLPHECLDNRGILPGADRKREERP